MSLNPHKNFVNIIILKRLTKKHPQKYIYSAQVRFEVVIDIIGEMKCCSQFQQIIQMSLLPLFLKGHDFYPPSELCVFHQALWSEIHLSQVFTQRFDTSDIKQTLTDRQEILTLSTKLFTL